MMISQQAILKYLISRQWKAATCLHFRNHDEFGTIAVMLGINQIMWFR